jgi:hypothetical protein
LTILQQDQTKRRAKYEKKQKREEAKNKQEQTEKQPVTKKETPLPTEKKKDKGKEKEDVDEQVEPENKIEEAKVPKRAWTFAPAATKYVVYTRSEPTITKNEFEKEECVVLSLENYQSNDGMFCL